MDIKNLTDNMLYTNLTQAQEVLNILDNDLSFLYLHTPLNRQDIELLEKEKIEQLEFINQMEKEYTNRLQIKGENN